MNNSIHHVTTQNYTRSLWDYINISNLGKPINYTVITEHNKLPKVDSSVDKEKGGDDLWLY